MPSVHIQARLMANDANNPRETDALEVYWHYRKAGYTDRELIREALIALGVMSDKGWQPVHHTGVAAVHETTFNMLKEILAVVKMMRATGIPMTSSQAQTLDSAFTQAANMLGEAVIIDIPED